MGEVKCRINIHGNVREYVPETTYKQLAKEYQKQFPDDIVLVLVNNRLRELREKAESGNLTFITTADKDGRKAYRRSTALLMQKAVHNLYGEEKITVRIMHSIAQGYYCELKRNEEKNGASEQAEWVAVDEQMLRDLKQEMQRLVEADFPIEKHSLPTADAVELFRRLGMTDKERLFRYRRSSRVNIYELDHYKDYFYGYMVPSTGYLKYFDLIPYQNGFMLMFPGKETRKVADFEVTDKWILSKVNTLAKDVTENMDKFELGIAVQKVYDFIWDEFCDWYIELVKYRIYHSDENYKSANAALWTLKTVLGNALKMLHPFMPFVTEEIYSALVPEEKSLMMSDWPQFSEDWCYADAENITDHMKEVIRGVRNARAEMNVPPSRKAKVYVVCEDEKLCEGFEELTTCACPLMSASELAVQADKAGIADDAVSIVVPDASVYVPLEELIDFEQEIERLTKEEEKLTKEINRAKGMLSNEKFVSKAPQAKVDEEKAKLEKYTQMMEQVKERLEALKAGR